MVNALANNDWKMMRYFVEERNYTVGDNVMPMRATVENDNVEAMKYLVEKAGGDLFYGSGYILSQFQQKFVLGYYL